MTKGKKQNLSVDELLEQALVPEDEQPYEVPENWMWIRLTTSFYNVTSSNKKLQKKEYLENGYYAVVDQGKELVGGFSNNNELLFDGKLPVLIFGDHTRIVKYIDFPFIQGADGVKVLQPKQFFDSKCYYYLLQNLDIPDLGYRRHFPLFPNLFCPLPPLAEQQRIVDCVESLFAKLDKAKELAQNALDSFETLKTAILHKALTGELTAKWRKKQTIEPAPNRLMNIINTQSETGNKNKELVAYIAELVIDDVLDSNGWLHLKAMLLCDNITCGGTPTGFIYEQEEIPFLKVYNIVDNKIAFAEKPQFTNREIHERQLKSSKLKPNDVVMNIVGPPLRKIAIIPEDYAEWNMNQAIVRFRALEHVLPKFLYYCLVYPATLDDVISDTKGVVGQANISVTQSRNLNIPVPSLEEQHEIVNILDCFFDNEQKAKELSDVVDKIDIIKKSILARAFRGELGTNDPSEENALDLLKEVVST